ncbi:hypothetical protein AYK25_04355 [Thermoplasmatales archaeon SM1-50]|nr:MAG: hypothetical protein AYK25_04355 [Thermoplasmatales archaeon SM1-50]
MIEIERKKNILKNIRTLVIVFVLVCYSYSTFAQIIPDKSIQNIQTTQSSSCTPLKGNITVLDESFSEGIMPPSGWILDPTNLSGTWKIDSERYHSPSYSASVWRHNCTGLMDEWLITPNLNFSEYSTGSNKIFLRFWWYTDIYVVEHSLIHFNVSISTNGGINWTKIWTAKDQSGFPEYKWTEIGMPIELSEYRNESNVTIGFQFFSNTTQHAIAQFFAIDDIIVFTTAAVNFFCDAGGPYHWWWFHQYDYIPPGVRFHGTVSEGYNPYLCQWLWDFGDNNISTWPVYTYNFYTNPGHYNVTLQVKYENLIAYDITTVDFIMPQYLNISLKPISFPGIQAEIYNPGNYNATHVKWWINVTLGPLKMREKTVANGTIEDIGNHSTVDIKSKYFFGFGLIQVEVVVNPENFVGSHTDFNALKIGPFTINLGKKT